MPIRARASATTNVANREHAGSALDAPERKAGRAARLSAMTSDEQYARALHRHLAGMPAREIDFFINPRRAAMLSRLIGSELQPGRSILNVACGPFALEYYVKFAGCHVESFDREDRLAPLHKELTSRGLIGASTFSVADVASYRSSKFFDVVLINDLFYARAIDFYELIPRYISRVKPGGLLYFDIQDRRAGPLWRAFGKDENFRRYDLGEVARVLRDSGIRIEAVEPALGIKGGLDGALRRGMWHLARLANSYAFVARKPE